MRGRPIVTFLILLIVGFCVLPMTAQQKPFTRDQVQGMVQTGLADETGAKAIKQRGIDFTPTEDFLQSLKEAGADNAFLAAVRAAKHPQPTGGASEKPLTQVQVFALLSAKVASERVAMLVHDRGIDFEPTDDYLQEVRSAGGTGELISALKSAKVTKPSHVDPQAAAQQGEIQQHSARGAAYMRETRYADAEKEYRAALRLAPQDADLHFNLGIALGQEGNPDGAIAEFREVLRLNPNHEWAHANLGIALGNKGDWDGEIAEEHEALRLNPNNDFAHVDLGVALGGKGDWDGETAEEREALRLNPKNEFAHVYLAMALGAKGDGDGQIAEDREALGLNPNNEFAHVNLGMALGNKGDWDGQISEEREALRLNPNNALAHGLLGAALQNKGDMDGGIAEFREALRLNPKDAEAHSRIGMALESKGDRQGASQEYRAAYEINPQNPTYRQNYERLSGQVNPNDVGAQADSEPEVPGVDLSKLSADQKQAFIRQLAGQQCPCGCKLTLLRCRQVDRSCLVSLKAAREQLEAFQKNSMDF